MAIERNREQHVPLDVSHGCSPTDQGGREGDRENQASTMGSELTFNPKSLTEPEGDMLPRFARPALPSESNRVRAGERSVHGRGKGLGAGSRASPGAAPAPRG